MSQLGLQGMADKLLTADDYLDVFPTKVNIREHFRLIARIVHPDICAPEFKSIATQAFQRLNELYTDAEQMIAEGRFGEKPVLATITTRKGRYTVTRKLGVTDLATLYSTISGVEETLLKVTRSPKDNDLMAAEAAALKKLNTDDQLSRAYPVLLDSFMYRPGNHRANILSRPSYDGYTAAQLRGIFHGHLDSRHVVWIWRKLLMALGYAHEQGVLHGAVLPPHVLILPAVHGVMLTDWYYSALDNGGYPRIKGMLKGYQDWYPEEVSNKAAPSPATDIAMAARVMLELNPNLPRPLRAFLRGCTLTRQSMRPQNCWALLEEFDSLLKAIGVPYYPRRFVEMTIPSGVAS